MRWVGEPGWRGSSCKTEVRARLAATAPTRQRHLVSSRQCLGIHKLHGHRQIPAQGRLRCSNKVATRARTVGRRIGQRVSSRPLPF
eukprot:scaffold59087_cov26-Tisochrysis_lutea.AAC.1